MPNYVKAEKLILSTQELELVEQARNPALSDHDTKGLLAVIRQLETAANGAGETGTEGKKTRADFIAAALRRAKAERRRRGLNAAGERRDPAKVAAQASAKSPAVAAKPASKPAAVRARNVASKPRSESAARSAAPTKRDLRTGPRRVAKPKGATAPAADHPAPLAGSDILISANAAPDPGENAAKEARKAARKAEKQIAKDAEKEARKAQRKAEKQAEKDAAKAQRKAERKAAKKAEKDGDKPAKAKNPKA